MLCRTQIFNRLPVHDARTLMPQKQLHVASARMRDGRSLMLGGVAWVDVEIEGGTHLSLSVFLSFSPSLSFHFPSLSICAFLRSSVFFAFALYNHFEIGSSDFCDISVFASSALRLHETNQGKCEELQNTRCGELLSPPADNNAAQVCLALHVSHILSSAYLLSISLLCCFVSSLSRFYLFSFHL